MSSLNDAAAAPPAHVTRFWIHYRMTDRMGVVYYGNYLELFEIARSAMIRDAGWRYADMEHDGFMIPVVRAEVDYLAPAHYEDELLIHTRIARLGSRRIDFHYEITKNDDPAVICRGLTRHMVVGTDGRSRRLDPAWLEKLGHLVPES